MSAIAAQETARLTERFRAETLPRLAFRNKEVLYSEANCSDPSLYGQVKFYKRAVLRWKQFATMMLVSRKHAETGCFLVLRSQLREEQEQIARRQLEALSNRPTVQNRTRGPISRELMIDYDKQLSRSKGNYLHAVETCPHPTKDRAPRGNQHCQWVLCLQCGGRWERGTADPPPFKAPPQYPPTSLLPAPVAPS